MPSILLSSQGFVKLLSLIPLYGAEPHLRETESSSEFLDKILFQHRKGDGASL